MNDTNVIDLSEAAMRKRREREEIEGFHPIPMNDKILLRQIENPAGDGVQLATSVNSPVAFAEVLAVGPGMPIHGSDGGRLEPVSRVGDIVQYMQTAALPVMHRGRVCGIVKEDSILMIVKRVAS